MPVPQPNQLQCDNMKPGDVVFVKQRSWLYKFIRKYIFKRLPNLRVRASWEEPIKYVEYYQEDCVLLYLYETRCVQEYNNEVPCLISLKEGSQIIKTFPIKKLQVGLYNIQLILNKWLTLTIPLQYIDNAIRKNEKLLQELEDSRKVQELLKFQRYKGNYFKKVVEDKKLEEWVPLHCSICGAPIAFKFNEDKILVDNNCVCGCTVTGAKEISYDELAVWYHSQLNPNIKNIYKEFWF